MYCPKTSSTDWLPSSKPIARSRDSQLPPREASQSSHSFARLVGCTVASPARLERHPTKLDEYCEGIAYILNWFKMGFQFVSAKVCSNNGCFRFELVQHTRSDEAESGTESKRLTIVQASEIFRCAGGKSAGKKQRPGPRPADGLVGRRGRNVKRRASSVDRSPHPRRQAGRLAHPDVRSQKTKPSRSTTRRRASDRSREDRTGVDEGMELAVLSTRVNARCRSASRSSRRDPRRRRRARADPGRRCTPGSRPR